MNRIRCLSAFTGLVLVAALGGCVIAPPFPPPGGPGPHAGFDGRDGPPGEGMHRMGHRRPSPPREWSDACAGRDEGAALQLQSPRGDTLDGRCERTPDGLLLWRPQPPAR